jgi:hypothetical protein
MTWTNADKVFLLAVLLIVPLFAWFLVDLNATQARETKRIELEHSTWCPRVTYGTYTPPEHDPIFAVFENQSSVKDFCDRALSRPSAG